MVSALRSSMSLAELDERAAHGDASPRLVEEVSRQGVQDDVGAVAVGGFHEICREGDVTRVEDVVGRDAPFIHSQRSFSLVADGDKDVAADMLEDLIVSSEDCLRSNNNCTKAIATIILYRRQHSF